MDPASGRRGEARLAELRADLWMSLQRLVPIEAAAAGHDSGAYDTVIEPKQPDPSSVEYVVQRRRVAVERMGGRIPSKQMLPGQLTQAEQASYPVSVRQVRSLPPASFGSRLAAGTLAFD